MRRLNVQNIRHLIRDCANDIEHALELMVKDEPSTTDAKFLVDFIKFSEDHLSLKGINLFNCVKLTLDYYYYSDRNRTTDNTKGKSKLIYGNGKFPFELKSVY